MITPNNRLCLHVMQDNCDDANKCNGNGGRCRSTSRSRDQLQQRIQLSVKKNVGCRTKTMVDNDRRFETETEKQLESQQPEMSLRHQCVECNKLSHQLTIKNYIIGQITMDHDKVKALLTEAANANIQLELKLQKYKSMVSKCRQHAASALSQTSLQSQPQRHHQQNQPQNQPQNRHVRQQQKPSKIVIERHDDYHRHHRHQQPTVATTATVTNTTGVATVGSSVGVSVAGSATTTGCVTTDQGRVGGSIVTPDLVHQLKARCQELEAINSHLSQHLTRLKTAFNELLAVQNENSSSDNVGVDVVGGEGSCGTGDVENGIGIGCVGGKNRVAKKLTTRPTVDEEILVQHQHQQQLQQHYHEYHHQKRHHRQFYSVCSSSADGGSSSSIGGLEIEPSKSGSSSSANIGLNADTGDSESALAALDRSSPLEKWFYR